MFEGARRFLFEILEEGFYSGCVLLKGSLPREESLR